MRPVTMYEADDGSRWRTEDEARARDEMAMRVLQIVGGAGLKARPSGSEFDNGYTFVQQPKGARQFLAAALRVLQANRDSDGPIGKLMYRVHCMDQDDREWGQPYFALNPTPTATEAGR